MPKSKRQRVTTLTKTPGRTTRASKVALVNEIRSNIDQFEHVWLFSVGDMRNEGLKEVRQQWRGTGRFFFGKTRVMAKALGTDPETEYAEGLGELGKVSRRGCVLTAAPHGPARAVLHLAPRGRDGRVVRDVAQAGVRAPGSQGDDGRRAARGPAAHAVERG